MVGDFGVAATGNQLVSRLIRWDTSSPVNHAFVYIGDGMIVEARPGGAAVALASNYSNVTWSTGVIQLSIQQRGAIKTAALADRGVGYGYLDIAAIAFVQKRWHDGKFDPGGRFSRWCERRISNMHYLICSQLVDQCYQAAGVHLFTDGRPAGLVSPGDLYTLIKGA